MTKHTGMGGGGGGWLEGLNQNCQNIYPKIATLENSLNSLITIILPIYYN